MLSLFLREIRQILRDFKDNCCDLFFGGISISPNGVNDNIPNNVEVINQDIGCNDSTNLYWFIRCNAPLFTIIGITGTMLSLIPTFLEKFIGPDWINLLLKDFNGLWALILVEIAIVSSALFILFLAIVIAFRLWNCQFNQEIIHRIGNYNFRRGHLEKILFCIFFYPLIIAFVIFIASIFLYQNDPYLKLIGILVFAVLYLLIAFFGLYLVIITLRITTCMKNALLFFFIVILILIGSYIYITILPIASQFDPYNNPSYGEVQIIPINSTYSIENSDTIGLPFVVGGYYRSLSDIERFYLNFHWTTNYGYFITNNPSDKLVKIHGSDFSLDNASSIVYWTYDVKDQYVKKPPVIISLVVENVRTKKNLNGTQLNMHWMENNSIVIDR